MIATETFSEAATRALGNGRRGCHGLPPSRADTSQEISSVHCFDSSLTCSDSTAVASPHSRRRQQRFVDGEFLFGSDR